MGLFRVELLCKLLCDSRSTSSTGMPHDSALDYSTSQCNEVNTRMLIETLILGSHKGVDQMRRQIIIVDSHTISLIEVPRAYKFTVG